MIDRLNRMVKRYNEITEELMNPDILKHISRMTELSKEQRSLEAAVNLYAEYKEVQSTISDLKEMLQDEDKDIIEMAHMELEEIKHKIPEIEEELKILLIPKDPNDDKNVIVEVRGAAGGSEANIFAGDLFRMYTKYAELKKWDIEIINSEDSGAGGFSQIEFTVSGDSVFAFLKFESGGHRVQRVPQTESQGRV
ncbi:MAG: PCRF domain-containing protein, partial [Candidatus Izimaplasma sp.]|nr:PCRF domain-containing protein [Candidatus Izimaplasma bacterium]